MQFHLPLSRSKIIIAWLKMLFLDDGYVRLCYRNFFQVDPELFRANHPLPYDLKRYKKRGIKSILNLRGNNLDIAATALQKKAALEVDMTLYFLPISSRELPSPDTLEALKKIFDEAEKPLLVHCKSGADRAGFVATLYLLLKYPEKPVEAVNQLKWYYGHFTVAETGILDVFLEAWKQFKAEHDDADFMDWVHHHYDQQAIKNSFQANRWWSWVVNKLLRRE